MQRCRAVPPPAGGARRHRNHVRAGAAPRPRLAERRIPKKWDECRRLSPMHAGMSYRRLDELDGIPWPCYDETHPGEMFLHAASGRNRFAAHARRSRRRARSAGRGARRGVSAALDDRPAIRFVQHRRAERRYRSPLRRGETLDLSPEDARRYGLERQAIACASARGAGRSWSRLASIRDCVRACFHDVPFQRSGRDESADDRRNRSEVGHRRVQSHRRPHRKSPGE